MVFLTLEKLWMFATFAEVMEHHAWVVTEFLLAEKPWINVVCVMETTNA